MQILFSKVFNKIIHISGPFFRKQNRMFSTLFNTYQQIPFPGYCVCLTYIFLTLRNRYAFPCLSPGRRCRPGLAAWSRRLPASGAQIRGLSPRRLHKPAASGGQHPGRALSCSAGCGALRALQAQHSGLLAGSGSHLRRLPSQTNDNWKFFIFEWEKYFGW